MSSFPPADALWITPPPRPSLTPGEIHVWRVGLQVGPEVLAWLWPLLSPDEHQRAQRFYFEDHRQRFVAARGALRLILGRYVPLDPGALTFTYGERGKPALEALEGDLEFNLSHSHHLALYALRRDRPVGVDLEYIRTVEAESMAERFFTPRETAQLRALPPTSQQLAFFQAWTRKEAYLKATGEGIRRLDTIEVTLQPGRPAQILTIDGQPATHLPWELQALQPGLGYTAALVSMRPITRLCYWQWSWAPS